MAYGAALGAFFVLGGFLVACLLLKLATLWFPEPLLYVTQAKDGRFGRLGPAVVFHRSGWGRVSACDAPLELGRKGGTKPKARGDCPYCGVTWTLPGGTRGTSAIASLASPNAVPNRRL
jgi:hypothetical protein